MSRGRRDLPTKEEVVLKRTKRRQRDETAQKNKGRPRRMRSHLKSAASFIQRETKKKISERKLHWNETRKTVFTSDAPRLGIVVRTAFHVNVQDHDNILQSFRLRKQNTGSFVKVDQETMRKLLLVSDLVVWGYPSLPMVKELLYRKATTTVNGKKRVISDNVMVENALGSHGILCLEDMVHELIEVGPAFNEVVKFLRPFPLKPPVGGWASVRPLLHQNSSTLAHKTEYMDTLLKRMI